MPSYYTYIAIMAPIDCIGLARGILLSFLMYFTILGI